MNLGERAKAPNERLDWSTVSEIIAEIPATTCGGAQPDFLYRLSFNTRGVGEIVEIGTYVGKSTIALAFGQKQKEGRPITTVDPEEHPNVDGHLRAAGVADYVNRVVARSAAYARHWAKPIELLWIDGDHSYFGVSLDIRSWSRFVVPGGIMAFHDYPGHCGSLEIARAISRYVFSRPHLWRVVSDREAGSIIAFERISGERGGSRPDRLYWWKRNLRTLMQEIGSAPRRGAAEPAGNRET